MKVVALAIVIGLIGCGRDPSPPDETPAAQPRQLVFVSPPPGVMVPVGRQIDFDLEFGNLSDDVVPSLELDAVSKGQRIPITRGNSRSRRDASHLGGVWHLRDVPPGAYTIEALRSRIDARLSGDHTRLRSRRRFPMS